MPEDANTLNRINNINREKVKDSLEENPLLVKLRSAARNAGRNDILKRISIDELTDRYVDSIDESTMLNNVAFKPDEKALSEMIEEIRFELSEEPNGFVVDTHFEYDVQASVEQSISAKYYDSPDYALEDFTRTQIETETMLGIERSDIVEVLLNEPSERQNSYSFNLSNLSDSSLEFLNDLYEEKDFSEEETQKFVENFTEKYKHISTDLEINGFITEASELYFLQNIHKLKANENLTQEQKNALLDKIASSPESKKYLDPETGKPSIKMALDVESVWQSKYLSKKRAEFFVQYNKERKADKHWSELGTGAKEDILRSAVQTLRDPKSSKDMILTAQSILLDLTPGDLKPINVTREENGEIVTSINEEAIISAYNGMRSGKRVQSINDIYEKWDDFEEEMTTQKLDSLVEYYDENGTLLTPEQYIGFQEQNKQMSSTLKKVRESIDDINEKENSWVVTGDSQKKLAMRLKSSIISFIDRNTKKEMSQTDKAGCVMAAYSVLKKAGTFGMEMELSNPEINKKALELLEKYILADPITYGNYINEKTDGSKEIKIAKGKSKKDTSILTSAELDKIAKPDSQYYSYIQSLLLETRKTAREEVFKDVSTKDKILSRDGVETIAGMARDGVKYFFERGMTLILGEDKAREALDNVESNKGFQFLKKSAYFAVGGLYHTVKSAVGVPINLIGRPLANALLPNSNRLALQAGNEQLKVNLGDLQNILNHEATTNFIDTTDKLEFIKLAVGYKNLNDIEKETADGKFAKMKYAQKFRNPETGKIDIEQIIAVGYNWENTLIDQKRAQSFLRYNEIRHQNQDFSSLSPKERFEILRAATCALEDKDIDPKLRNMAIIVLNDISPALLNTQQDRKSKAFSYEINTSELMKLYNEIPGVQKFGKRDHIIKSFQFSESKLAMEKLESLSNPENFISREEWEVMQVHKAEEQRKKAKAKPKQPKKTKQKSLPEARVSKGIEEAVNPWRAEEAVDNTTQVGIQAGKRIAEITGNATVQVGIEAAAIVQAGKEVEGRKDQKIEVEGR